MPEILGRWVLGTETGYPCPAQRAAAVEQESGGSGDSGPFEEDLWGWEMDRGMP
jgi:hypothetical protein